MTPMWVILRYCKLICGSFFSEKHLKRYFIRPQNDISDITRDLWSLVSVKERIKNDISDFTIKDKIIY